MQEKPLTFMPGYIVSKVGESAGAVFLGRLLTWPADDVCVIRVFRDRRSFRTQALYRRHRPDSNIGSAEEMAACLQDRLFSDSP